MRIAAEITGNARGHEGFQTLTNLRALLRPPAPTFDPRVKARLRRFWDYVSSDGRAVDIGSGSRRFRPNVVTMDLVARGNVDCVADAQAIPFRDEAFDAAVSFAVLEHVEDPARLVAEALRVLRPGGVVYFDVPFLQGYHTDPEGCPDYWRFTLSGLRRLCRDFERIEDGVSNGCASAVVWTLREMLAAPFFHVPVLGPLVRAVVGWATFPLKYLDLLLVHVRACERAASGVYFIGRKPGP